MNLRSIVFLVAVPLYLQATQIQWYCPPGLLNMDSEGQAMNASYKFELGVFANGFTPTLGNLEDWAENWNAIQRASYNETHGWFTSVYQVTGTEGIAQGTQTYIWGFKGDPANGEWLLCSGSSWVWPAANPENPFARIWNATQSDLVILGSVSNGAVTLQSAIVSNAAPPTTTYAQWAEEVLGDPAADPSGDANNNGIQDGLEYVMGESNNTEMEANGLRIRVGSDNGEEVVELLVPYRADRPALIDIEISFDLETWYNANDLVNLQEDQPLTKIFRDQAGVASMPGPWFWRYTVTPEE